MFKWLKRSNPLEDPTVPLNKAYDLLGGLPSSSGVSVNYRSALGNPAVWRGVNLISQSVAKIPCNVYKRGDNASRTKATNHPAYRLLRRPNELYTAYTFKATMQQHALLYGNGYAWINRDEMGKPVELLILDPEATHPILEGGRLQYVTQVDGNLHKLSPANLLHIKGLCADAGLVGWSVFDVLRDAIGLGLSLQKYGNVYFKSNAKPSVVIELPPNIRQPEQVEAFRAAWGSVHSGLDNAHRPALLQSGGKVIPVSNSNDEGQYNESRQFDLLAVANVLGLPPHKLGSGISTSYSSLESENKAFLSDSIDHWLCNWEQEIETKLLTKRQKATDSHFCEFDRKALISIDAKTEIELLTQELNNGLLSWSEARQKLNLPTDKDDSQEWRRPANIVVEGDEPEPAPAPLPPMPADEVNDNNVNIDLKDKARAFTKLTLDRLVKRIVKASEQTGFDLAQHRSVFVESLAPYETCEQFTDGLFATLKPELDHVLPEQRASIIQALDTNQLCEDLCN